MSKAYNALREGFVYFFCSLALATELRSYAKQFGCTEKYGKRGESAGDVEPDKVEGRRGI